MLPNLFDLGYLYVQCIVETRGDTNSMAYDYGYIKIVEPSEIIEPNRSASAECEFKVRLQQVVVSVR